MKKILLYLASNSLFYTNLYPSIKRGFEEAGCVVEGGPNLLESEALLKKIEIFQPDFIFEMNRVKSEIKNFPDNVIHICWLVDFWGRQTRELTGSDILYVWDQAWVEIFKNIGFDTVFYLPPATDMSIFKPLKLEKKFDFVFLGHIPKEWTQEEKIRIVGFKDKQKIDFQYLLTFIKEYVLMNNNTSETLFDYLQSHRITIDKGLSKMLMYDIMSRSFRHIKRNAYLDLFLERDYSLTIYGSENWLLYDKFRSFYKTYISDFNELNSKMQEANILLHDGYCPHFRTFDAMAAGVVVAAAKPVKKMEKIWSDLGFEDKKEYISIDMYSKEEVDYELFKNKKLLRDIQITAREKVLKNHLWVHRAEKVLVDINEFENKLSKQLEREP